MTTREYLNEIIRLYGADAAVPSHQLTCGEYLELLDELRDLRAQVGMVVVNAHEPKDLISYIQHTPIS